MNQIFQNLRYTSLRRTDDGMIGGVCAGIAHRWGIAPILVRLLFFCLLFFGGIAFLIYGILWFVIPKYPTNKIELEEAIHGDPHTATAGSLAFILLGLFSFLTTGVSIFRAFPVLLFLSIPAAIVLAIVLFLIFRQNRDKTAAANQFGLPNSAPNSYSQNCSQGNQENSFLQETMPIFAFQEQPEMNQNNSENETEFPQNLSASQTQPMYHTETSDDTQPFVGETTFLNAQADQTMPNSASTPNLQHKSSPRISGRFVMITIAVVFAAAALTLGLMPSTYGSWAVTAGVISMCLGGSVFIAGILGKRATWLTALTWLAAFPTVCAIFFSLVLPNAVVTDAQTRGFVMDHHFIPRTEIQQENIAQPSLVQSYTYKITTDYPSDNVKITTGLAAGSKFYVPDDQPVIFKIKTTGFGSIGLIETLKEWDIQYRGETFKSSLPGIYQPGSAESKTLTTLYEEYTLDPGEQIIATSPAAIENPQNARVIEIEFGFGEIQISAAAPGYGNTLKYAEEVLKIPVQKDSSAIYDYDTEESSTFDSEMPQDFEDDSENKY